MKKFVVLAWVFLAIYLMGCSRAKGELIDKDPKTKQSKSEVMDADSDFFSNKAALSAQEILSTGPHGETATAATSLSLSKEEIAQIKEGQYTAAIIFHYAGNDWSSAQERGLRDAFKILGIDVISVTDAQFKAEKQVSDIENSLILNPDIIISIPVDPVSTAPAYRKAVEQGITLVFMDNAPNGLTAGEDYVAVVSADNYGNGVVSARIMGTELGGQGKIGVIFYDADFFVTNQRVAAFERTITEEFPSIEIVSRGGFNDPNKVSTVADGMLTTNPDIDGIFAVWDVPAESVVASAKAVGKNDLIVTTIDLGNNVARIIAEDGMIKGLGAQLPYDQGVAEATLAAYKLLEKEAPTYVAVPSFSVKRENLLLAYEKVYHQDPPKLILDTINSN